MTYSISKSSHFRAKSTLESRMLKVTYYVYVYVIGLDRLLICPGKDYNKLYIYLINYNYVYFN